MVSSTNGWNGATVPWLVPTVPGTDTGPVSARFMTGPTVRTITTNARYVWLFLVRVCFPLFSCNFIYIYTIPSLNIRILLYAWYISECTLELVSYNNKYICIVMDNPSKCIKYLMEGSHVNIYIMVMVYISLKTLSACIIRKWNIIYK